MRKLISLIVLSLAIALPSLAQTRTVSGTVSDAATGEPLIGATVIPVGSSGHGTATDVDGKFTLNLPTSVKEIKVNYVGYDAKTLPITSDHMEIALQSTSQNLDEVMVVAYGTAKKSAYTGSASVVKADQIENTLVTDVTSALKGSVAGVQLQSFNGAPGVEPTIYVRGTGSLTAITNGTSTVQPLYVVDGVPYDGNITSISPNDVESMTVLKDAAAAALYGARGANGVILITTKKGREGNAKVTLDMNWGANSREITNYKTVNNTNRYYSLIYQALRNSQLRVGASPLAAHEFANAYVSAPSGTGNIFGYQTWTIPEGQGLFDINGNFNPNAVIGWSNGENYIIPDDWAKNTYTNGFRQEYSLSVSGGSDRYDYMVSANYLDSKGVIKGSSFSRFSTRANANYQAFKWLKIGTNLSYTNEYQNYPLSQTTDGQSSNAFYMANMIAPIYPFYLRSADGKIMTDPASGNKLYDYGMLGLGLPFSRNFLAGGNPTGTLIYDTSAQGYDTFDGKWYAQITPVEGLTITGTAGYWLSFYRYNYLANAKYGQMVNYGGMIEQDMQRSRSINLQALANYVKSWGKNNFDFLIGYESYDMKWDYLYGEGTNIYNDNNPYLSNVIDNKDLSGYQNAYATRGIFGRINYDFANTYYASVSYRRDASSRFAPGKRWGNFWSVSGGVDLRKIKFMENAQNVDMLKIKASFGQQGNDNIGNYYAYLDQYYMTGSNGVWNVSNLAYKGNPDLTWESSNSFNAGVDFSFFEGKLAGTVEYFQRQTGNMLYNKPVNPSLGYSSFPMNVGSMRNNGIELELNATPFRTQNFSWNINFNMTYQKNKILKLAPELDGEWINGSMYWKEGESMYNLYLVKYAGVDSESGLPLYWAKDANGDEFKTTSWQVAYSGNTADGSKANRCATGDLLPPVFGGFGTTLNFFGVDASIQFGYQIGGKIWDYGYQMLMHGGGNPGTALHEDALKSWTPENPSSNIPILDNTWQYINSSSDRWLTSARYLTINNINLGYTLPAKITRKWYIDTLRIYVAADNVALWSARKGLDPRQDFIQSYAASYSALRTISAGIKVTF